MHGGRLFERVVAEHDEFPSEPWQRPVGRPLVLVAAAEAGVVMVA